MLIAEQVILALFSSIGAGLILALEPLIRVSGNGPRVKLWLYGVANFSLCWALFAVTPWLHPAVFLVVTSCGLGSAAFTALFFRSTYRNITPRTYSLTVTAIVMLAVVGESFQLLGALDVRLAYLATVVGLLTLWQTHELIRSLRHSPPKTQKVLWANLSVTALILSLIIARFAGQFLSESADTANLFDQDISARTIRWLVTTLVVIRYFLMATYLLTHEGDVYQQALSAELSQQALHAIDNQDKIQLNKLLIERDQLIQSLTAAKENTADTGPLAVALIRELKLLFAAIARDSASLQTDYGRAQYPLPDRQALLNFIQSANHQATDIISTLENIVLQATVEPERTDVATYIRGLEPTFLRLVETKGIAIDIQYGQASPCEVDLQPAAFQQAIICLLKRAITAHDASTSSNKRIVLEIKRTRTHAQINLMDNAEGLRSAFAANIDGWFEALKEANADLCVGEYMIQKLQGRLSLEITDGWSTALKVEFPLSA